MKKIAHFLFFRLLGWREEVTVERPQKCIICVAPHTSNLDFFIAELYYWALGRHSGFLMKKEWFFWPLGPIFRSMGGIPVERSRHGSMTDRIAETARKAERFEIAITPEGTRSLAPTWKRGFYYIAQKAQIPILCYVIDYKQKLIRCTLAFTPTEDAEADWARIMDYYRATGPGARYPEKFQTEN